jgi:hypothetical protein
MCYSVVWGVNWTDLAQDSGRLEALVSTPINVHVP